MPTIKKLFDDLVLMLNQSDPSDDFPFDIRQFKFWLTIDANATIATECNNKLKRGEMIPAIYQIVEECITPTEDDPSCADGNCGSRLKINLSQDVMTLNNDGGIVMVTNDQGLQVTKVGDIQTLMLLQSMRFAKPTNSRLVYWRSGSNLFIAGNTAEIPFDSFFVYYVPKFNYDDASDSAEVVISDLSLPILQSSLYQRAKLEFYGSQVDAANDGIDPKTPVYHTAISNQSANDEPTE